METKMTQTEFEALTQGQAVCVKSGRIYIKVSSDSAIFKQWKVDRQKLYGALTDLKASSCVRAPEFDQNFSR